jgi:peptidyl-prolyl cis-trans isomerase D
MLQNIRDKAQGWIAYGIVILISVPFALWGIQEYMGVGSEPLAAKVNGTEITQRAFDNQYQRFRQEIRAQLGSAYRPELFEDKRMRQEVLNRMIRDQLVEQAADEMGLRVSDIEVQSVLLGMDAFKKDGRFDQATFERVASLQGLTPAGFMERVRKMLLTEQLAQMVSVSTFVTEHEKREAVRLMTQQREFSYFVVPAADYLVDTPVDDSEIQAYYDANQAEFLVPERVKLSYIELNADSAGSTLEVSEDQLRAYYEDNQEQFGLPEQRQASHILILAPEDADESALAEAKENIEGLRARAEQGEDFAELARDHSQDPGSAESGGDLGYFGRGVMDPAFEEAVFAMQPGEVSEPVRSSFGFHLIKLQDIKAGSVKPFDMAKSEIEQAYRKAEGESRYFELAEKLADFSYEDPSSLEPAAEVLGLEIMQSDWLSRNTAEGVLATPKALNAAFSEDVLVERYNSELIEIDQESSLVLRVDEHEVATTQPVAEVKERIAEILRRQNAEAQAQAEADKRQQEIDNGAALAQVAGSLAVTGPLTLGRNDRSVPLELMSAVFSSAKPAEGGATTGTVSLASGDVALFSLQAVKEGGDQDAMADMLAQSFNRELERSLYDELVADLESRADIEILMSETEE